MIEAATRHDDAVSFGPFRLLPRQRLLTEAGRPVRLGSRALEILTILAETPGELVTKEKLLARVWPQTRVVEDNLTVHVSALRRVLGDGADGRRFIVTVPGRGYSLVAEVSGEPAEAQSPPLLAIRPIGQAAAIATLAARLADRRLLTITGPGGVGKTTLALGIAQALAGRYAQGIRFLDLAASAAPALERLGTCLRDQEALLLLDNCEHLVEPVADWVASLLRSAPRLSVLVTSREALGLPGEQVYRLAPLAIPPAFTPLTAAEALAFAAVELFVERVSAQVTDFALTDADAPAVAAMCRQLGGLPLAIELAATLVDALGIGGLGMQLRHNPGLTTTSRRAGHAHQRTLPQTFDWSYRLLSGSEQTVLRRLSVISLPFCAEAARRVAGSHALSQQDVMAALVGLVGKSLIEAEPDDGAMSYRLLEPTRAFALEQLHRSGEFRETWHCLAAWYLTRLDRAEAAATARLPVVPAGRARRPAPLVLAL